MTLAVFGWEDYWDLTLYHKVTFDGPNRLILINDGVTTIDIKTDLYSSWKHWLLNRDNAKYIQAMRGVGGDPTIQGRFLGSTFFLENGWKIRTWEGDHRLTVEGNLFSSDGNNPFVPTIGNHNIVTNLSTSNLIDTIDTDPGSIAADVWNASLAVHKLDATFGKLVQDIDKLTKLIPGTL